MPTKKKKPTRKPRASGPPKIEILDISQLSADPANLNKHPEEQRDHLVASFKRFGAGRSITIDAKNISLAGSGALDAAKAAGVKRVIVVDSDGTSLVAVRRKDLSRSEGSLYALADNQIAKFSQFNDAAVADFLKGLAQEGFSFEGVGFDDEVLEGFLDGVPETDRGKGPEPTDLIDAYKGSSVRQIMLLFNAKAYVKFLKQLEAVKKTAKVDNNTDAVIWLVEKFAKTRG